MLPDITEWQNRPLEEVYPIVFFDGIVFNVRQDSKVSKKCVYSLLGINLEGYKEILGIWLSENESASFYASICADLRKVSGSIPSDVVGDFFRSYRRNHVLWDRLSL